MRWRTTIILGLVLLIAAAGLFYWKKHRAVSGREQVTPAQKLLPPGKEIKDFWLITRSDSVRVGFVDSLGRWMVLYPVVYPADSVSVNSVVAAAESAYYDRVIADAGDPADFGLAPKPWVRFIAGGDTFSLGEESPSKSGVYAQIAGDKRIFLVPEKFRRALLKVSTDLRNRTIYPPISPTQVDSVVVFRGDTISLVRRGFVWYISRPEWILADEKMVEQFTEPLFGLVAIDFGAEEHTPDVLREMRLERLFSARIFLADSAGERVQDVDFYAKPFEADTGIEFIYAVVPQKKPLFEVGSDVLVLREMKFGDLMERTPLSAVADAEKVTVTGPGGFALTLQLEPPGWFGIYQGKKLRADDEKVESLLKMFSAVHIDSFIMGEGFVPKNWRFCFVLAPDTVCVEIGERFADMVQFRISGDTTRYFLTRNTDIERLCSPQNMEIVFRSAQN